MSRIAPTVSRHMLLWRPVMAEPPIYSLHDLRTWVTMDDVFNANEVLDLKGAMAERARDA